MKNQSENILLLTIVNSVTILQSKYKIVSSHSRSLYSRRSECSSVYDSSLYNSIAEQILADGDPDLTDKKALIQALKVLVKKEVKEQNSDIGIGSVFDMKSKHNQKHDEDELFACTWGDESPSEIKHNLRYRHHDSRRRSSIERIMIELEEFKGMNLPLMF